jgi:general secretion pathway protein F
VPLYAYRATDTSGRILEGQIEAKSHEAVVERLQRLTFFPLEIRVAEGEDATGGLSLSLSLGKGKRRVFFTTQLATLLEAGLPVDRSLAVMEDLTDDKAFAQVIGRVRESVEGGRSLADALRDEPSYFDDLYVNMVRAGESGGALEIIMRRLAEFLEESQRVRDFIVSSLTYPAFLILFSVAAVVLIFVSVLPRFAQIFADMGELVPLPARVLMNVSRVVGATWWMALLGLLGAGALLFGWVRTTTGRLWWDRTRLSWPLLGSLMIRMETARFARTLGTLLSGGVPILQAVDIVGQTVHNRWMAGFMGEIKGGLKKGQGLVAPLRRTGVFPPLFIHMATVGEETGRLEEMLVRTASIFEREVETSTKGLLSLLEPIIMVFLGVVLGGIIISILWAIFSVYKISF